MSGCFWNRTDGMWLCRLRGCENYGNRCESFCEYYLPIQDVPSVKEEQKFHNFIQAWANAHYEVGKYILEDTCEVCGIIIPKNTRVCPKCKPKLDELIAEWTKPKEIQKHYY